MDEISNKTLATLLVVAIVVSLGGTFISLNRLSTMARVPSFTGFGTGTGRVNVTITESSTISTPENLIWFGEGRVNDTDVQAQYADLWSNGTKIDWLNSTGWMPDPTYTDDATYPNSDFIIIQNDGNLRLNITLTTELNASEYLCGGLGGADFTSCNTNAIYGYWSADNESGSCSGGVTSGSFDAPTNLTGDGSTAQVICQDLLAGDTADSVRMYAYVRIPYVAQGSKNDTLTFTSTSRVS